MNSRLKQGRYRVFTARNQQGNKWFTFGSMNRKGLLRRLEDTTWKPLKLEFSLVDFTDVNASGVYKALKKRTDLTVNYTNCTSPKETIEVKANDIKDSDTKSDQDQQQVTASALEKLEATTDQVPTNENTVSEESLLKELQANLETGIKLYDGRALVPAINCFDLITVLFDLSKTTYDDKVWRLLLQAYYHSALIHTELELDLITLNTEHNIYSAWKCFINITNKTESDMAIIMSVNSLITFPQDPVLEFVRILNPNYNLAPELWDKKFDELFTMAQQPYFSHRPFIMKFTEFLINSSHLISNKSLNTYLSDSKHLTDLTNNLKTLISIHDFYQPFANQPGSLYVNMMHEMQKLRVDSQRLQLENQQLKSTLKETENNIEKKPEQAPTKSNDNKTTSQYKNASVLYGIQNKPLIQSYNPLNLNITHHYAKK